MTDERSILRETFWSNPLIERYRFGAFRPPTFWIQVIMYAVIVGLILLVNYVIFRTGNPGEPAVQRKALFIQFLVLDVLILWGWASFNAGSAISSEIANKSFDFFKALPLTPCEKAAGIVVGTNLMAYLLGLVTWAPALWFAAAADISLRAVTELLLVVLSGTLLFNTGALLSSIRIQRKARQPTNPLTAFVVLVFFLLPMSFNAVAALAEADFREVSAAFYGIEAPLLIVISAVMLYFSVWTVIGLLRKFKREREPMFSRNGALLFVLGFQLVATGFFAPHLDETGLELLAACWIVGSSPLLFVLGGSLREFNSYVEHSRSIQRRPWPAAAKLAALCRLSNVSLGLMLFGIWAIFAFATSIQVELPSDTMFLHLLTLLSFYAFYLLLIELYALFNQASGAVKHLLALVAILDLILPFILAVPSRSAEIALLGPLGYFTSIFADAPRIGAYHGYVAAVNVGLLLIPAALILTRYRAILRLRRDM